MLSSRAILRVLAIAGAVKAPSLVSNIVADIVVLTSAVRNIKFIYYNKYVNKLDETKAKKVHHCIAQTV